MERLDPRPVCVERRLSHSALLKTGKDGVGDSSILELGQLKGWASRHRATSVTGHRARPRPGSTWQQREAWEGPSLSETEKPGLREKMP